MLNIFFANNTNSYFNCNFYFVSCLQAIKQEYSYTHDVTIDAISTDFGVIQQFYANHGASVDAAITKLLTPSRKNPWSVGPLPDAAPGVTRQEMRQEIRQEVRQAIREESRLRWMIVIFVLMVVGCGAIFYFKDQPFTSLSSIPNAINSTEL